ncbi:hypothetical protein P775_24890 [Puniceibacterium antarcticum]|uniref:Uncharacterized protein n=1 Tax=Puniceibacterium antarcticum TaxID=1206336 RepID=A0A2G8R6H5_9RHOB|nr:hypothetical protein P775_24890 [Puniceibacterium antarcticum]
MDAAVLAHQSYASRDLPCDAIDKWQVLRDLATAREAYELSDRDITVLQALVSFSPGAILGGPEAGLVVYPSNQTICDRLNGMPSSTMRRHLSRLVQAGLVLRRDSPNGKRFARRYGAEKVAFGFDLSPLVTRFDEFKVAADAARHAAAELQRKRQTVSLMRRDIANLAEFGATLPCVPAQWDRFSDLARLTARDLRRKLNLAELTALEITLGDAIFELHTYLEPTETDEMGISESQNEQHHQNSNKETDKSDLAENMPENCRVPLTEKANPHDTPSAQYTQSSDTEYLPKSPLNMVLSACREIQTYSERPIRSWRDLEVISETISPMMGITPSAWNHAKQSMGRQEAAAVLSAMLERFTEVRSHGAYLRHLSDKAALGLFSSSSMLMALLHREAT